MVARNTALIHGEGSVSIGDRSLVFLQVGDPSGPLILHNHGGPSSRLEAKIFEPRVRELGLRLVCVDRPGQGRPMGSDQRKLV
jgi:pimeloyl-ACP methyl ester carboxylesterase